ncbi:MULTISPECIES: hypothetical protein [Megasphaera]|uniref:Uncharacterized protein n=1 Tax=Megasphaera vaginalis (ex Srinivasan et al. 2021) TaxID=1111454 RepID=U7UCX9_9FIRM|nr:MULTISPECIES: hypothetical protein [Megasphaera]ERT57151.1 hypothetical protein HMPREF1250_1690 [Megasphaera vaginalis (ex Srinivasan et al. 2021)]
MDSFDNIAQYPIYFAPGCKLLQLEPEMVSKVYDYLHQLFGNINLYTRCCGLDDSRQQDEEAVFITLCDSCFKVYGETYANLHMRDFWDVYDEYKDIYPLYDEAAVRKALNETMTGVYPKEGIKAWFNKFNNN